MATNGRPTNNHTINVKAWPVTKNLLSEPTNNGSLTNPESLLIKVKIKVTLVCLSNTNTNPTVRKKYRAKKYSGTYTVSGKGLLSDDGSPNSPSWSSISDIIGQFSYYIPFSMDKVQWVNHQIPNRSTHLERRDQLVTRVLKAARAMAVKSTTMERPNQGIVKHQLHLSIKKNIFVDHDGFIARLFVLEQKKRFREILNECISQLEPPLDGEVVKRKISNSFSSTDFEHRVCDDEKVLERLTEWIVKDVSEREMKLVSLEEIDRLQGIVYDDLDKEECGVCKRIIKGGDFTTRLGCSVYHADCVKKLLQPSNLCPLCRSPLPLS